MFIGGERGAVLFPPAPVIFYIHLVKVRELVRAGAAGPGDMDRASVSRERTRGGAVRWIPRRRDGPLPKISQNFTSAEIVSAATAGRAGGWSFDAAHNRKFRPAPAITSFVRSMTDANAGCRQDRDFGRRRKEFNDAHLFLEMPGSPSVRCRHTALRLFQEFVFQATSRGFS